VGSELEGWKEILLTGLCVGFERTLLSPTARIAAFPRFLSHLQLLKVTSPPRPLYRIDVFFASRKVNPVIVTFFASPTSKIWKLPFRRMQASSLFPSFPHIIFVLLASINIGSSSELDVGI
jgi:hypothetical protein